MPKKTQDSMIKNLIMDCPVDALDFFEPLIIQAYGRPVSVKFNFQEVKKHSHYDMSMKNDIPVTYTFAGDQRIVLVLIEHWSDKSKFDIHRFAHYIIDMSKRFPDVDILPVALFTDKSNEWHKMPQSKIRVTCMNEIFLEFRYRLIRMKEHEAEKYRDTKNRFISVMRSAMRYDIVCVFRRILPAIPETPCHFNSLTFPSGKPESGGRIFPELFSHRETFQIYFM